ncbi:rhomboid family intramembrane serine protease [Prosthecobacter debontii]|nr:rhomboid family intramembrane serine protease [Prosthecobacter debontii]
MSIYDRDYMRSGPPPFGEWIRERTAFQWLFALNVMVFVLQWGFDFAWVRDALTQAPLRPAGGISVDELADGHFWTPFTHLFVHAGWWPFLGNMLLLWFAGRRVQALYSGRSLVFLYCIAGLLGAAVQLAVSAYALKNTGSLLMGASASVLGLVLAYAVAMPEEEVPLLVISQRAFARLLMAVNAGVAVLLLTGHLPEWAQLTDSNCFAHLGGGLAGWYYARSLGYGRAQRPRPYLEFRERETVTGSSLRRRPQMARTRPAARRPDVDVDLEAVRRENPQNDPLVDLMKDEVDPILDKINDHGMGSLTEDERRTLERASRRFTK